MSDWPVYVLAAVAAVAFCEALARLRIAADARRVLAVAPTAYGILSSDTLPDSEKESQMRRMSVRVLRDTLAFVAKIVAALALCLGIVWLGQVLLSLPRERVLEIMVSWPVLVGLIPLALLYTALRNRGSRTTGAVATPPLSSASGGTLEPPHSPADDPPPNADAVPSASHYGPLARLLHRVAFAHPALQRVLGELEDDLFARQLRGVRFERPVFVTGLPRSGTTLVLELLHRTGAFASFTYRQMPFVQAPLLWDRIGSGLRREATRAERAHGDGVAISFDSPEAFEEVLWLDRLGERVLEGESALRTLGASDLDDEFRTAFTRLATKLVHLAGGDGARYLSKNNANVARLPALPALAADARVLCCYRHPATQIVSLHKQHLRFLEMHGRDAFAERYMRWIGHHDFGANFRPIRFPAHATSEPPAAPEERLFWLRYWIDAYAHALDSAPPNVCFVGFESLTSGGAPALENLADAADLDEPSALVAQAERLRVPTSTAADLDALSPALAEEARAAKAAAGSSACAAPAAVAPPPAAAPAAAPAVAPVNAMSTGDSSTSSPSLTSGGSSIGRSGRAPDAASSSAHAPPESALAESMSPRCSTGSGPDSCRMTVPLPRPPGSSSA